jgi:hypothetical protein
MILDWSLGTLFWCRYGNSKFELHFRDGVPVSSSIGTDSVTTVNPMTRLFNALKELSNGTSLVSGDLFSVEI